MKEELENARIGFFGDVYDTLKERLDAEIEYLNNLDFSVSKKAKHYVITIKVEEVEE